MSRQKQEEGDIYSNRRRRCQGPGNAGCVERTWAERYKSRDGRRISCLRNVSPFLLQSPFFRACSRVWGSRVSAGSGAWGSPAQRGVLTQAEQKMSKAVAAEPKPTTAPGGSLCLSFYGGGRKRRGSASSLKDSPAALEDPKKTDLPTLGPRSFFGEMCRTVWRLADDGCRGEKGGK